MNTPFRSQFAAFMEGMISFKESLGYSRSTYEPYFKMIDRFCLEHYPDSAVLSKDLVMKWVQLFSGNHPNGVRRKIVAIREFGKYLKSLGHDAYIYPTEFLSKTERYKPYIFTDAELRSLFSAFDAGFKTKNSPYIQYVLPVIFRLTYTCGLRPGEVRRIKCEDVNLITGRIYIRESKANKDRIVMMSKDMLCLCRKYENLINMVLPDREYFFPNKNGTMIGKQSLSTYFSKCCKIADISNGIDTPRVYDLRHNHVTRTMMKWLDEGRDLYTMLPYLNTYMGHYDFSQTAYYIHLLPERLIRSETIDWNRFSELIPEVRQH